jgi:hypothetical protein
MAILGCGSQIQFSSDGGTTYGAAIGQVLDIVLPNVTAKDVDISFVGMAGAFRLFQAGLCNGGDCTLKIIFDKTVFASLYGIIRVTKFWKMTYSDLVITASTLVFQAYIKDVTQTQPLDDKCEADFKMKVTNAPIFTAGT